MSKPENPQDIQQKPRFHPGIIDDASKAAAEIVANYQERRSSKTKDTVLQTISEFEEVIAKIPDIFAKDKELLSIGFGSFKDHAVQELAPFEAKIVANKDKSEAATAALAARESTVLAKLAELQEEINVLKKKTEELEAAHNSLTAEYERITYGKLGFMELLKNLKPGRKKFLSGEAGLKVSQALENYKKSKLQLREKQSAKSNLESDWNREKYRANDAIYPTERTLEETQEQLENKIKEIFKELGKWLTRLQKDIENCSNGAGLNEVNLLTVDVRSRVDGVRAMASQEVDRFTSEFERLSAYKKFALQISAPAPSRHSDSNREAIPFHSGLHPISADPGDGNQTSFQYFVDDKVGPTPTLFYTGQILETVNDSVSRRFVSCVLVEVFSPKSSRHVAFHLPPRWMRLNGMTQGAHFLEYNPLFFYEKLKEFVEKEGCDFEDLDIKVVSGINVPPDQIQASLKALGCDEKKIGLFQLPSSNFSTLTLADQKKILILGGPSKFLEPGQTTNQDVFSTVGGGNNGYGHKFLETPAESRYVV